MMFLHWPRVIYDVLLTLLPTVTFSLGANLVISREEVKITTSRLPVVRVSPQCSIFPNRHPGQFSSPTCHPASPGRYCLWLVLATNEIPAAPSWDHHH